MFRNGFSRESIRQIAVATKTWPGDWSLDLVGDVVSPAVVLIAEAGDRFGPALHLEQVGEAIQVTAVRWDTVVPVGEYAELDAALDHLGKAVAMGADALGSTRLN